MLPKTIIVFDNYSVEFFYKTQDDIDKIIGKRKVIFKGGNIKARKYVCDCVKNDNINELAKVLFEHLSKFF